LSPERLSALKRIATIESIGSSTRIEGSKLSDIEVETLLLRIGIQKFESRDEQEVAGYADVMETIFNSYEDIPVTERYIKQLHRELLKYSEKDEWHRGQYKTHSNSVAAFDETGEQIGVVFQTATPFDTPHLMEELLLWYKEEQAKKQLHSLLIIGIFIVVFLEIHPFQDGNGRISRVITTLLLQQAGYVYVPYCSLESIIEQNKEAYYIALRKTQLTIRAKTPDWNSWITFFLNSLQKQKNRLEKKVTIEKTILVTLPELSLRILEMAKQHGRVSMNDMIRLTGISRNTIKLHFRSLVDKNYLQIQGGGRSTWYTLK
jgi:Fic family protein